MLSHLTRFVPSWRDLFPFLRWFPLGAKTLRADFIAGVTGGLVLVPQAMAYAQLAGLPPHYGLYTGLLPGAVAALWGSSSKLSTGPVAIVSLLTGSALAPLAVAGSDYFISLAILLALLVGLLQLGLGVFKLGVVVNFISHPVIVGFTNAAAIIIALSQLNKLLGVPMDRGDFFVLDIWGVLKLAGNTHLPTLALGLAAFAIMWGFRRYAPKFPGVLIAVVLMTGLSWAIEFERTASANFDRIMHPIAKTLATDYGPAKAWIQELNTQAFALTQEIRSLEEFVGDDRDELIRLKLARLNYELGLLRVQISQAQTEQRERERQLREYRFELNPAGKEPGVYLADPVTARGKPHSESWRVRAIGDGELHLAAGGEVVGKVPSGLPGFGLPPLDWRAFVDLFSIALVVSLVGFMEAISIAKAMAAKTKERLDPNQELIGQGLANIAGSLTQSFPSSGSFARSAVNYDAGAATGFATVFATLVVAATLLFLTPLLYYLPQSVLAAVVMMAVVGLINFKAIKHIWQAHRHDGIAAAVTFVAALALAPHLDDSILIGAGLSIILYLYRRMNPRVVLLAHREGLVESVAGESDAKAVALRFDGSLYFANVPYFVDAVLEATAAHPKAKYLLVVGDGINELDASGEEAIRQLTEDLSASGVTLVFSGIKHQVLQVMERAGLYALIGAQHFFRNEESALEAIDQWVNDASFEARYCPASPAQDSQSRVQAPQFGSPMSR